MSDCACETFPSPSYKRPADIISALRRAELRLIAEATLLARPPREDHAAMARYLIHANEYGTLATRSRHLHGAPFANVVSVSDGAVGNSTGRLLFYLTPMDSTAYDLQV